jgi:hypothetical protein
MNFAQTPGELNYKDGEKPSDYLIKCAYPTKIQSSNDMVVNFDN